MKQQNGACEGVKGGGVNKLLLRRSQLPATRDRVWGASGRALARRRHSRAGNMARKQIPNP